MLCIRKKSWNQLWLLTKLVVDIKYYTNYKESSQSLHWRSKMGWLINNSKNIFTWNTHDLWFYCINNLFIYDTSLTYLQYGHWANLNKSEEILTNTNAASKYYIPRTHWDFQLCSSSNHISPLLNRPQGCQGCQKNLEGPKEHNHDPFLR